jgi:hypothetical protein
MIPLLTVLCRFSVSVVKQKLDFFPQHLFSKWWATPSKNTAAIPNGQWCHWSELGKMLIKAIASCLVAALAVNSDKEFIAIWRKLTWGLWGSSCLVCPSANIRPVNLNSFSPSSKFSPAENLDVAAFLTLLPLPLLLAWKPVELAAFVY